MATFNLFKKLDIPLLIIVVALISFGLLTIYGIGDLARDFFYRQLIFLGVGLGVMFLISRLDYRIFKNISFVVIVFYVLAIILLLIVLQSSEIRSVRSWITLGNFRFEPSELAKLALIILLAKYFSQRHIEIRRVYHVIVSFIYAAIPAFLVFVQPDLGSGVIFFIIWLLILIASGIKTKHMIAILIFSIIIISIAWIAILEDYQKDRITSFLDPFIDPQGSGYNIIQSRIAIGAGSWFGMGLGKGTQSSGGFLPEAHTDFIFASMAEQFGLLGVAVLFILVMALVLRIIDIIRRSNNNFARFFGIGFISFFGAHILLNVGINIGLLPVTGIPLSFISYGGSHLIVLMIGIGIIQSIKTHSLYI